ncbi:MAG: hypothetical protein BGO76_06585 [Caedibacter sp. 38-128]|nr:cupin-like domain-containing protein [Holosporales bacterium]OJX04600.1 MAG: hypothetical protein BGO76_06585 [Caedibacter sp. 38-128]
MYYRSKNLLTRIEDYHPELIDRSFVHEIEPFIFSNSLKNWTAFKLWSPSFFKEKYGEKEFNVNPNLPDKVCPYFYNAKSYHAIMKFADFIELMSENNSCYLAQEDMSVFKELKEDYNFYDLIPSSVNRDCDASVNLWLGANTRSGLHFDNCDNFLAQIYGTKTVVLIPPEDAKFVYPIPSNFFKSPVNPLDPDFSEFPKFKKAKIFEGQLNAGDVLFIPKGWYHYIYSPSQSISLNCWYGPPLTPKDLLLTFYRSGWRSWLATIKDFVWFGILSRPFEAKLYSAPPVGKGVYELIKEKVHRVCSKVIKVRG